MLIQIAIIYGLYTMDGYTMVNAHDLRMSKIFCNTNYYTLWCALNLNTHTM